MHGIEAVVHLAARVHLMRDRSADPLAEFRRVNVQGTLNLAEQAAAAGVRRFVFLSSIKVNGESTPASRPFTADDEPAPLDPYAISKHEAEQGLRRLAHRTGMELVVIRPPLVYGPGVKANFRSMLGWLNKGIPLPFASVNNRRSMVALDNLVDLIATCLRHPRAPGRTWLVSDGEDLSTPELLRRAGHALGREARLLACPPTALLGMAALLGRAAPVRRLCESLTVDISVTRRDLEWTQPSSVDAALLKTALEYLQPRLP